MAFGNVLGQGVNLSDYPTREEVSQEIENSGVQMATGSYVGTGTYGQSNPNSLTFGFAPQVIIFRTNTKLILDSNYSDNSCIIIKTASQNIYSITNNLSGSFSLTFSWGNNNVSWWTNASTAIHQFNNFGTTYYYLALGGGVTEETPEPEH